MSTLAGDGAKMTCSRADLRLLQGETQDGEKERRGGDELWKPVHPDRDIVQTPAALTLGMSLNI